MCVCVSECVIGNSPKIERFCMRFLILILRVLRTTTIIYKIFSIYERKLAFKLERSETAGSTFSDIVRRSYDPFCMAKE